MTIRSALLAIFLGALVSACGDSDPSGPKADALVFTHADPVGDTTIIPVSQGMPRAIDLLSLRGDLKRDSLILTLTFAEPVLHASANAANSLAGFIEIDIDDNRATGNTPASNFFGGSANLGINYVVAISGDNPSRVDLLSARDSSSSPVLSTFLGNVVTIRVPMAKLGRDDGNFSVVGVIGTLDRPTDVFPNTGAITARRPSISRTSSTTNLAHPLKVSRTTRRPSWEMTRLLFQR